MIFIFIRLYHFERNRFSPTNRRLCDKVQFWSEVWSRPIERLMCNCYECTRACNTIEFVWNVVHLCFYSPRSFHYNAPIPFIFAVRGRRTMKTILINQCMSTHSHVPLKPFISIIDGFMQNYICIMIVYFCGHESFSTNAVEIGARLDAISCYYSFSFLFCLFCLRIEVEILFSVENAVMHAVNSFLKTA